VSEGRGRGSAIERAQTLLESQRTRARAEGASTAATRRAGLTRLARALTEQRGDLAAAMRGDFGKPAAEVEITEIQPVLREIRYTVRHLEAWMRPRRVPTPALLFGTRSEIRVEPKGVVLILAPWNYPIYLALMPLVAAVAAGNRVVLKPSERVPQTSAALARLVATVWDEQEVAVVLGDAAVARELVAMSFDHIFFTGGAATGRKVLAAAASRLTPVTLELGGKSPAIVDQSADVEQAARRIVWGKFVNAGQTCVAPDYVYVHETVSARFIEAARRVLTSFYGESDAARQANPDYSRLVDGAAWERLTRLLDEAVAGGARIEVGGERNAATRYLAPTIVSHVRFDTRLMDEEIFGPVLPVVSYRDQDEVYRFVAQHGKPLALYVFSGDQHAIEQLLARTAAGGTMVNNTVLHLANPHLPFGGVGESGFGNYHGRFGFTTFSHERAVVTQRRPDLLRLFYPPYGPKVQRALRLVDRLLS
jgi:aldehyde dehydrogenase (NAD+)